MAIKKQLAKPVKKPIKKKREYQRDKMQGNFVLLVIFAVCVIVLAIVASIFLTQQTLGKPKPTDTPIKAVIGELTQVQPENEAAAQAALEEAMNFWPSEEFPSVPQYKTSKYKTTVDNMYATIVIPAAESHGLTDYIGSLVESGAAIHVRTENLTVLLQAGTEIQIRPIGARPSITLCGESQITWTNSVYEGFILPRSGKLISVKPGNAQDSTVFTYRNAAISDTMQYLSDLKKAGWINTRRFSLKDNTLLAYFKKADHFVTIDYFTEGNYQITLSALPDEPLFEEEDVDVDEGNWQTDSTDPSDDEILDGDPMDGQPEEDQPLDNDPWGDESEDNQPEEESSDGDPWADESFDGESAETDADANTEDNQ